MPITQDRMIALIAVGETLLTGIEAAKKTVRNTLNIVKSARADDSNSVPEYVRDALYEAEGVLDKILNIPIDLIRTLEREKTHFEHSASKNRKTAQASKRMRLVLQSRREEVEAEFDMKEHLKSPVPTQPFVYEYEATPTGPRIADQDLPKPIQPEIIFDISKESLLNDVREYLLSLDGELSPSEIANFWRKDGATNEVAQKLVEKVLSSGMCVDSGKYGGRFAVFTLDPNWKPETDSDQDGLM